MGKLLDFLHKNKRWLGLAIAGGAIILRQTGYHEWADWILTGGTIAGVGYLPPGPNAPQTEPSEVK